MYDFHFKYIKRKYDNRARLLFTDTDSLTYEIEAEEVYKDFWNDKDMFDNSDYLESSPYYCNANKKVIGKVKDEACSVPIVKFIGLKSEMYSYVKDNEKGGKTAEGKSLLKGSPLLCTSLEKVISCPEVWRPIFCKSKENQYLVQ